MDKPLPPTTSRAQHYMSRSFPNSSQDAVAWDIQAYVRADTQVCPCSPCWKPPTG